jgi:YidC/Oxa1 family membrane protein insertase
MDKRTLLFVLALSAALFFVNQWFGTKSAPKPLTAPPAEEQTPSPPEAAADEEQFFVLENAYQQLVFSNRGGSIAEINLPLKSETHPASVVLPIAFDRSMAQDYEGNDYFPSFPYYVPPEGGGVPIRRTERTLGGYYPLLRRTLFNSDGLVAHPVASAYYACALRGSDAELSNALFQVTRFEKDLIQFEATLPQRKIVKTYSFPKDPEAAPYCIDVSLSIQGDARGVWLSTGVPEVELISGNPAPSLKYRITRHNKPVIEQVDLPKASTTVTSIHPDWLCNSNGFLGLIVDPLTEVGAGFSAYYVSGENVRSRLTLIDARYDRYPAEKYPGYEMRYPLRSANQPLHFRLFAGPFDNALLQRVDATYTDRATGYNPDYTACQTFHGWFAFISEPFARFLFILMKFFYQITHSWGFSIILLTAALRVMLYPLNAWSIKSTAKMQQVAPETAAIQAKYKKDPKKAQMEIMALYRERGINPLSGCFPLLIQMPFLIGMFDLLKSAFDLRGASFIPGWIDNLTAPDVVLSWDYPILFFGTSFHLLPLLLGAVMYFQQRFSSPLPKDTSQLTDQQKQQRTMGHIMTIVFTVMFYHFPSGLNIYWLSSMLLGILQQWYATKALRCARGKSS